MGSVGVAQLGMPEVFTVPALVSGSVGLGFYLMRMPEPAKRLAPEHGEDAVEGI